MILSDHDLMHEMEIGGLTVDPYEPELLQPASIDLRLSRHFTVANNHMYESIDPAEFQPGMYGWVEVEPGKPFVLHPGEFALASTYEVVQIANHLVARIEGKSSLGRLGLLTHATAGFVDPGFSGTLTLELSNAASLPIKLWPGMVVAQLCVMRLASPAAHPYTTVRHHYQGQRGPTPSRSWEEWRTWPV